MQAAGRVLRKEEVEELVGCSITDGQFLEASTYAARKQEYIYEREGRPAVLCRRYLAGLAGEYVKSLAFSKFTMDLCMELRNMEKEHPAKSRSAQKDSHIVTFPAL